MGDFSKLWRNACKAAGFSGRRVHDLRRTGVRNLIRAGVSQTVAKAISGHRSDSMFRRYDITSEADLREAAERLTRYLASLRTVPTVKPIDGLGYNSDTGSEPLGNSFMYQENLVRRVGLEPTT